MMPPIKERIRAALEAAGGRMNRYSCMHAVFPPEQFPRAWRYQANGGPPGCAMAFGRALREMRAAGDVSETGALTSRILWLCSSKAA